MTHMETDDRRVRRTRLAVFEAFRALMLTRRYDEIRVSDIIDAADIGRSTFYDHFKNKDDVLLGSVEPLFEILADAAVGKAVKERLFFVLSHFWDQRALAQVLFGSTLFFKLSGGLEDMIEERLPSTFGAHQKRLIATDRATAMLGVIKAWLAGEFSAEIDSLADYLASRNRAAAQ